MNHDDESEDLGLSATNLLAAACTVILAAMMVVYLVHANPKTEKPPAAPSNLKVEVKP